MKPSLLALALTLLASRAYAELPALDANCPQGHGIHIEPGDQVFIDGAHAQVKRINDHFYEARLDDLRLSISLAEDGSVEISYNAPQRVHGVCTLEGAQD